MNKKQREPRPPEHLEESVSTLHGDASGLVLDAVRLWREHRGSAWTERILVAAFDVLAASEAMLGAVLELAPNDGESVAPVPNGKARH